VTGWTAIPEEWCDCQQASCNQHQCVHCRLCPQVILQLSLRLAEATPERRPSLHREGTTITAGPAILLHREIPRQNQWSGRRQKQVSYLSLILKGELLVDAGGIPLAM
jgi:hypothetical protein